MIQPKPELLTQEWREEHCLEGDEALRMAHDLLEDCNYATTDVNVWGLSSTLAAIAQAHYAAVNVRAKPSEPRPAERNKYPTALELVDGPQAWHCPKCGSDRSVGASLNGGVTIIKQCVPCGHYDTTAVIERR